MKKQKKWHLGSWRKFPVEQQVNWPDERKLTEVLKKIRTLPPLVFAGEIRNLRKGLAQVEKGEAFLLHAGDCAEDFSRCNAINIRESLKVILQMAVVLIFAGNKPVIKLARMAGQYSKPRSNSTEVVDGNEIPIYRGDSVNSPMTDPDARIPDPDRLLQAYFHSSATLNLQRAFVHGGYADLHQVHIWNKEFVAKSPQGKRYEKLAAKIDETLEFMKSCGITPANNRDLKETDLYISHEALILSYEEALTRCDSLTDIWYDCGTHMVWIGARTNQFDGAHVEFCRGIHNPIGIKINPDLPPEDLIRILDKLNPENEYGRINLITRFGHNKIRKLLPKYVKLVQKENRNVSWSCDPMHGNTFTVSGGIKTRNFDHILSEIKYFFEVHKRLGTVPGGIHLELTGENVTEICGGAQKIMDRHLGERYFSNCDPRLNGQQSLEMAFEIADMIKK